VLPEGERRHEQRRTAHHGRRALDVEAEADDVSNDDLRALIAAHADARGREADLRDRADEARDARIKALETASRSMALRMAAWAGGATIAGAVIGWMVRGYLP